jgi:hypothetical protein
MLLSSLSSSWRKNSTDDGLAFTVHFKPLPTNDPQRRSSLTLRQEKLGYAPPCSSGRGLRKTIDYFDDLLRSEGVQAIATMMSKPDRRLASRWDDEAFIEPHIHRLCIDELHKWCRLLLQAWSLNLRVVYLAI